MRKGGFVILGLVNWVEWRVRGVYFVFSVVCKVFVFVISVVGSVRYFCFLFEKVDV